MTRPKKQDMLPFLYSDQRSVNLMIAAAMLIALTTCLGLYAQPIRYTQEIKLEGKRLGKIRVFPRDGVQQVLITSDSQQRVLELQMVCSQEHIAGSCQIQRIGLYAADGDGLALYDCSSYDSRHAKPVFCSDRPHGSFYFPIKEKIEVQDFRKRNTASGELAQFRLEVVKLMQYELWIAKRKPVGKWDSIVKVMGFPFEERLTAAK